MVEKTLIPEKIPYPHDPFLRMVFKSPIVFYRLGLGRLVGRLFMVLTTTGRKSGQPRRTGIEYHRYRGRMYVMNGYGMRSDWYRNLLKDPRVTVQTDQGTQSCLARPLTTDEEYAEVFGMVEENRAFRTFVGWLGFHLTREEFVAQKTRWPLVVFEPTDQATPPPLQADLTWVWPFAAVVFALGWLAGRSDRSRCQKNK